MARFADINPLPDLFTIGPRDAGHEVGFRVALTSLPPLLLLLATGRMDLALYATFAGFTAIYGRGQRHGERVRTQLRAGVLMLLVLAAATVAAHAGVSSAHAPWKLVASTALVAGVSAFVASFWNLRPGGSLFHIFAFASVASLPFTPPAGQGMLTALAVVVWALVVGVSARLHREHRDPLVWPAPDRPDRVRLKLYALEASGQVIAAALAGAVATATVVPQGIGYNYWAMMAAVVVMVGHSARFRVNRGLQRVIGTFLGLLVTGAVILLDPPPVVLLLIITALQVATEAFIARQYVLAQMFITPMALLSVMLVAITVGGAGSLSAAGGLTILRDRFVETVIGASVGVACVLAPWLWRRFRGRRDPAVVS